MSNKKRADLNTAEWQKVRRFILERDGHRCAYCGDEATTVDHIIPVDLGGGIEPSNLVAACNRCNAIKSNKLQTRTPWVRPGYSIRL